MKEIPTGTYFGEVAIIRETNRTATIKSKNYSTLTSLKAKYFKEFKSEFPEIIQTMDDNIYKYDDKWKTYIKNTLRKIDFFSHECSDEILDDIYHDIKFERYEQEKTIFSIGDYCTSIYIVLFGKIDLYLQNHKEVVPLTQDPDDKDGHSAKCLVTLSQGSNLGTYTFLLQDLYSFKCIAQTD